MMVAARITCETRPGRLRTFHTASDKSCSWRPGNEARLNLHTCTVIHNLMNKSDSCRSEVNPHTPPHSPVTNMSRL